MFPKRNCDPGSEVCSKSPICRIIIIKIVILFGSPNRSGSTSILADEFTRGAQEMEHPAERIDVCHADVHLFPGCR